MDGANGEVSITTQDEFIEKKNDSLPLPEESETIIEEDWSHTMPADSTSFAEYEYLSVDLTVPKTSATTTRTTATTATITKSNSASTSSSSSSSSNSSPNRGGGSSSSSSRSHICSHTGSNRCGMVRDGHLIMAHVSKLSPLDILALGYGTNDATGNVIWMGALLFLHALPLVQPYLLDRHVLELGSGTGMVGLAVWKCCSPKSIWLTDASMDALHLCQINYERNRNDEDPTDKAANIPLHIQPLIWGSKHTLTSNKGDTLQISIDTVVATDVLYDIDVLRPLLETAWNVLNGHGGIFILSHVPRAALPSTWSDAHDDASMSSLDAYILHQATYMGFVLKRHIHPKDLIQSPIPTTEITMQACSNDSNGDSSQVKPCSSITTNAFGSSNMEPYSLHDMQQIGASIMIFMKQEKS